MKTIEILNQKYELVENLNNCFNLEDFKEKLTEYFEPFDYIFGDYSYDKLRLKGFYKKEKASEINNIENLDKYKEECCKYETKMYLLKKV